MFGKFYNYVSNLFGDDKKANADKRRAAADAEEKRVRQYQRSAAFVALVQPNPRFANQGLEWFVQSLNVDADGDYANEFLDATHSPCFSTTSNSNTTSSSRRRKPRSKRGVPPKRAQNSRRSARVSIEEDRHSTEVSGPASTTPPSADTAVS